MNSKELWELLEKSEDGAILRYIIMEINYLINARDFKTKELFKYLKKMNKKLNNLDY